jgi:hypothetical protein
MDPRFRMSRATGVAVLSLVEGVLDGPPIGLAERAMAKRGAHPGASSAPSTGRGTATGRARCLKALLAAVARGDASAVAAALVQSVDAEGTQVGCRQMRFGSLTSNQLHGKGRFELSCCFCCCVTPNPPTPHAFYTPRTTNLMGRRP